MTRMRSLAMAAAFSTASLALVAPVAQAADKVPFTITENIDFTVDPTVATFTATGPLCSSGTFVDDVRVFAGSDHLPKVNLLVQTVYTCNDGSGTFNVTKHVFLEFGEGDSSTNSGPVSFKGGTGSYVGLTGHGVDNGSATNGFGVGEISGVMVQH